MNLRRDPGIPGWEYMYEQIASYRSTTGFGVWFFRVLALSIATEVNVGFFGYCWSVTQLWVEISAELRLLRNLCWGVGLRSLSLFWSYRSSWASTSSGTARIRDQAGRRRAQFQRCHFLCGGSLVRKGVCIICREYNIQGGPKKVSHYQMIQRE